VLSVALLVKALVLVFAEFTIGPCCGLSRFRVTMLAI